MKRTFKVIAWIAGGIVLLAICVIGYFILRDILNPEFKETKIYSDNYRIAPTDTVIDVNGVRFKMIGVKGGKIDCKGLKETIELDDFYIGETEVTQQLWAAIMGYNPSALNRGDSLPVENIDLVECLEFVHRLDSITGNSFAITTYPEWLYAANLGATQAGTNKLDSIAWHYGNSGNTTHAVKQKNPNNLGIYDMLGNVSEWTTSGSDPLFIVAGGSINDEMEEMEVPDVDYHEYDHGKVKTSTIGLRLVSYPANSAKNHK